MNRLLIVAALAVLCLSAAHAQKVTELRDPPVTLVLPSGFTAWTPEQIARKFPPARPPKHVYAPDDRGRVTIAVSSTPAPAELKDLPQLRQLMETAYERTQPDAKWLRRETITLNGTPWVHLELETQALDTRIHNDLYATLAGRSIVLVNINAVAELYKDRLRAELLKCRDSITLKPAAPPAGSPL